MGYGCVYINNHKSHELGKPLEIPRNTHTRDRERGERDRGARSQRVAVRLRVDSVLNDCKTSLLDNHRRPDLKVCLVFCFVLHIFLFPG